MKLLISLFLLAGCGHTTSSGKLTAKAKEVEVFAKKPTDCDVVGKFEGKSKTGSSDLALNNARNLAAKQGATGVFVDQEVANGKKRSVFVTAYQCN